MTLVERLRRGPVKYFAPGGPVYEGPTLLASEAADEIERLEKALGMAREANQKLHRRLQAAEAIEQSALDYIGSWLRVLTSSARRRNERYFLIYVVRDIQRKTEKLRERYRTLSQKKEG